MSSEPPPKPPFLTEVVHILAEGTKRLFDPSEVSSGVMVLVGLAGDTICRGVPAGGRGDHLNLNLARDCLTSSWPRPWTASSVRSVVHLVLGFGRAGVVMRHHHGENLLVERSSSHRRQAPHRRG